jgi:hypothetical protein
MEESSKYYQSDASFAAWMEEEAEYDSRNREMTLARKKTTKRNTRSIK